MSGKRLFAPNYRDEMAYDEDSAGTGEFREPFRED
jgi:hypothetical protein